jgi:hypothetical protein
MARRIYVQRADDVSPLAAMAIVGLFLTVVGPALVVAAGVVAGLAALAAYTVACDLGGWLVVLGATTIAATRVPQRVPAPTWPLTGGLIKIMKKRRS